MTEKISIQPCFSSSALGGLLTFIAFLVLFFAPASAPAQSDTVRTVTQRDSLITLAEVQRKPKNALLWAAIPGGGQAYNKRWWKVPIVYGGMLGMIAYADFNQTTYTRYTRALENRCYGDGNIIIDPATVCVPTVDEFPANQISDNALLSARVNADKARQTAYIGIFAVYLLQAVEAYTDAHLQEFDISDDLSIRLGPVVNPDGMMAAGLTMPLGSGRKLRGEVAAVQRLEQLGR